MFSIPSAGWGELRWFASEERLEAEVGTVEGLQWGVWAGDGVGGVGREAGDCRGHSERARPFLPKCLGVWKAGD